MLGQKGPGRGRRQASVRRCTKARLPWRTRDCRRPTEIPCAKILESAHRFPLAVPPTDPAAEERSTAGLGVRVCKGTISGQQGIPAGSQKSLCTKILESAHHFPLTGSSLGVWCARFICVGGVGLRGCGSGARKPGACLHAFGRRVFDSKHWNVGSCGLAKLTRGFLSGCVRWMAISSDLGISVQNGTEESGQAKRQARRRAP